MRLIIELELDEGVTELGAKELIIELRELIRDELPEDIRSIAITFESNEKT